MATIAEPSGVQAGATKNASLPPAIVVTLPVPTSDDEDRRPLVEVRVAPPVRGEGDARAVGRPGRRRLGGRAARRADRAVAGGHVDEPQVGVAIVDEAGAVELVGEPVDVAVVGAAASRPAWAWAGGRGARRPPPRWRRGTSSGRRAVEPSGDQAKSVTPRGRSVRRRASPPSSGSRWTWIASRAVLRLLGLVGLLLDQQAAVGHERERTAVGREPGVAGPRGRRT